MLLKYILQDMLHWLPFWQRIITRIAALVWWCLLGLAPVYLGDLCCPTPSRHTRVHSSVERKFFRVIFARTSTKQNCAFSVIGPSVWNGIPMARRLLPMVHTDTFFSSLKTVPLALQSSGTLLKLFLVAMFPLSCARARARTAFQPSAHSIFSVPTNLKSFHYYFEVIFAICPSYLAYDLERPRFPFISVTLVPRS